MEWVTWFVFESPAALGSVLGLVLFALLVHWRRSGQVRPLLFGLGVTAALLLVQVLVVTRREHAGRILAAIERDIVAARTGALEAALAPDFESQGLDRDDFLTYVRHQLDHVRVNWIDRWELKVRDSQADAFEVSVVYLSDVRLDSYAGTLNSAWSLRFVRTPAGWRIGEIHAVHIGGYDRPSWRAIGRR